MTSGRWPFQTKLSPRAWLPAGRSPQILSAARDYRSPGCATMADLTAQTFCRRECPTALTRLQTQLDSPLVANMNRKPSILVVFLTVFIDLIGFGIVVPLVPLFSRNYGASGFVIGVII